MNRQRGIAAMFSRKDSDPIAYDGFWSIDMLWRNTPVYRELCRTSPQKPRGAYGSFIMGKDDANYLNPEFAESWLVNRPGGNPRNVEDLVRWTDDPSSVHYSRFFLDPRFWRNHHYAKEWFAERARSHVPAATHIALDNLQVGHRAYVRKRAPDNPDLAIRDLTDKDSWERGLLEMLAIIKGHVNSFGISVAGNHSLDYVLDKEDLFDDDTGHTEAQAILGWEAAIWERLVPLLDAIVTERPIGYDGEPMYRGTRWHRAIMRHLSHLDAGKQVWWITRPATWEEFMYLYCSWLMIWRENSEKQLQTYFHARPHQDWPGDWQTEYDDLGEPLRGMVQIRPAVWWRPFRNGHVIVNASDQDMDGAMYPVGPSGAVVQIPAGSGRIVRRD